MKIEDIRKRLFFFEREGLPEKTVRAIRLMLLGSAAVCISDNITGGITYTGYWTKLGASNFQYGLIVAIPSLFVVFQLLASWILEKTRSRKKIFLITGLIIRLYWIPFALIPYIIGPEHPETRIILSESIIFLVAGCASPMFNVSSVSISNDMIPIHIRGRYSTLTNFVTSFIVFFVGYGVGWVLDSMKGLSGYTVMFLAAAFFGFIHWLLWTKQDIPPMQELQKKERKKMLSMLKEVWEDKNYIRFTAFAAVRAFGLNMLIPYFVIYLLSDYVQMSNAQLVLLWHNTAFVTRVLFINSWGRALDKYGCKPVLRLGGFFTSIMPILWMTIGKGSELMVALAAFCTGVSLAACDLAVDKLQYSEANGENRSFYFAFYAVVITLIGSALATAVGGWLLDYVFIHCEQWNIAVAGHTLNRYNYFFVFGGLVRFFPFVFMLGTFREVDSCTMRHMIKCGVRNTLIKIGKLFSGRTE